MHDDFPLAFSQTFRVRYDECGPGGWMRASAHLRACQEIAFAHSEAVGFPLSWYEQHRFFWILRRIRLVLHQPARYGHALTYTTRVQGARKVFARRKTTARREPEGVDVATCIADWIFTRGGAQAVRIDDALVRAFPAFAQSIAPAPLAEMAAPPSAARRAVAFRATDLDDMRHANHAVYIDLFDDAITRAGTGGLTADGTGVVGTADAGDAANAHPRTYDLLYRGAATAVEALVDVAWDAAGIWHYRLERSNGSLVLHGRLAAEEAPTDGV
jgi:acyl-CoA thioesterase FadM